MISATQPYVADIMLMMIMLKLMMIMMLMLRVMMTSVHGIT